MAAAADLARVHAAQGSQPTQAGAGGQDRGSGFFQRCLAKSRGSTAAERRLWREGIYDQIREVMSLQGNLSIERMCQLAQVSRAGFYRSLQEREPVAEEMEVRSTIQQIALEHAIAQRQSPPGLVHHSDRGVQYASDEYVQVLRQHQMIPSMSRPANPYDNASCESFMKTLKREEIYANHYRDLDHLRANIEAFIDQYYNSRRLHSALGYKSPEEFEQNLDSTTASTGATMSFFRHGEDYRPDDANSSRGPDQITRSDPQAAPPTIGYDESPAGYSLASCSPAELASASPAVPDSEAESLV